MVCFLAGGVEPFELAILGSSEVEDESIAADGEISEIARIVVLDVGCDGDGLAFEAQLADIEFLCRQGSFIQVEEVSVTVVDIGPDG
jgi:hypothetical protein